MADAPTHPGPGDDAGADIGGEPPVHAPRWVKVSGVIALVVVAMLALLLLAGGGQHGPGRHAPSGDQQQRHPGGH